MQNIAKSIFIETSYPGVTLGALILNHGTILIDAPLRPEDTRSWRAALINQHSSTNRMLINLDAHPDRTFGARAMECAIIAQQRITQVFRGRPLVFKGQNIDSGSEWESYGDSVGTRWAVPDITFCEQLNIHWGPPDVILEHHPGPAPGATWVIIPDHKILFVGDLILFNQPPFLANSDIPAWLESLNLLKSSYKNYTIISGRGGAVPYEAIRSQAHVLTSILKGIEKIAKRHTPLSSMETIIPGIMENIPHPAHLNEQYVQRLKHGLGQYYLHQYHPTEVANPAKTAEQDL